MNRQRTAEFFSGMKRSTIAGLVLIPLGAWVALSPYVVGSWDGDFHFGRFLLAVLPGSAAALGGLIMLGGRRAFSLAGGALALASGAWLIVGPAAYALFGSNELGSGPNGESIRMLQWVGFFAGAGALTSLLATYALGLLRPLEFSQDEWAAIAEPVTPATATGRARMPAPAKRPRRQRRTTEPAQRKGSRAKNPRDGSR
jgi:hypothetical protein